MKKQDIIRYLQSIIVTPLLAIAVPLGGIGAVPSLAATNSTLSGENSVIITQEEVAQKEQLEKDRKDKAEQIDNFFAAYNAPLEGYGMKFVTEAEENGIDYRLLPAIAMRESTGGKHACKRVPNSVFGYGSCKISFESIDKSIEVVAASLGGNNPTTAHHYDNKTTLQILKKYNSVIPSYTSEIVKLMKKINDDGNKIV
jgi:hypothetical protein